MASARPACLTIPAGIPNLQTTGAADAIEFSTPRPAAEVVRLRTPARTSVDHLLWPHPQDMGRSRLACREGHLWRHRRDAGSRRDEAAAGDDIVEARADEAFDAGEGVRADDSAGVDVVLDGMAGPDIDVHRADSIPVVERIGPFAAIDCVIAGAVEECRVAAVPEQRVVEGGAGQPRDARMRIGEVAVVADDTSCCTSSGEIRDVGLSSFMLSQLCTEGV